MEAYIEDDMILGKKSFKEVDELIEFFDDFFTGCEVYSIDTLEPVCDRENDLVVFSGPSYDEDGGEWEDVCVVVRDFSESQLSELLSEIIWNKVTT